MPDSGYRGTISLMHFLARMSSMDAVFTPSVRHQMKQLGGGFEKLRSLRAAGTLKEYVHKSVCCRPEKAEVFENDEEYEELDFVHKLMLTEIALMGLQAS